MVWLCRIEASLRVLGVRTLRSVTVGAVGFVWSSVVAVACWTLAAEI